MNKITSVRLVKGELKKVNQIIDYKILHGFSYHKEAQYHKSLLNRLNSLTRHGWMGNPFTSFT
ncbi:MAG: hypothetical protein COU90_01785 [Candidatus Ryanbacteria bacterium CG10_big_fil_rev_8_21_14_0_10_43_42]|uniref:Uncharacterized protein n=1 Tax=Candidatus Ryanbacteria bacterium CG10_big_fil_rev_8_21_14_0_10_43_42 TaxID=1974864 RepID=A0A2M8KXD2_9BACT|nr:MAG: hypothetical protein COU90_01785 [Candidatus Ryanbacteria bacterium CG10_big_fil_rev_8_21_14_0_10_43_42]